MSASEAANFLAAASFVATASYLDADRGYLAAGRESSDWRATSRSTRSSCGTAAARRERRGAPSMYSRTVVGRVAPAPAGLHTGIVVLQGVAIHQRSATQAPLVLSFGEAEYLVRAASEGLGVQALARDLEWKRPGVLHTSAPAAIVVPSRSSAGRVRHIECRSLHVQDALKSGRFRLERFAGPENLLTNPHGGRVGCVACSCANGDRLGVRRIERVFRRSGRNPKRGPSDGGGERRARPTHVGRSP